MWRSSVIALVSALALAAPAEAARVPTRGEDAALNRLLSKVQGDDCADALTVSRRRPLIADGGRWGLVSVYCQFGDPPSGAGTFVLDVWARRSTPTGRRWKAVATTAGARVPQCRGEGGVLNAVPERILDDLRSTCNVLGKGDRPAQQSLSIFRNALHRYDDLGPWLTLSAFAVAGSFSLYGDPEEPSPYPTVHDLTEAFGAPQRTDCTLVWPRIELQATACADGRVTQLVLRSPWLLEGDIEADDRGGPMVRVGDHVKLARYLDFRLQRLPANGSLVLPLVRIGTVDITVTVIAAHARITAIQIDFQQVI